MDGQRPPSTPLLGGKREYVSAQTIVIGKPQRAIGHQRELTQGPAVCQTEPNADGGRMRVTLLADATLLQAAQSLSRRRLLPASSGPRSCLMELERMMQVGFSTTIAREPEDVFDLVADITRNTEWAPGFTYAEKITPGPVGLGSTFNTAAKRLGPMQIEIVEYERPTRLGFIGRARPVEMHHHFTLTSDNEGEGTRADQRIEVRPKGLLRLMSPLMAVMLKRMIQRNTADLTTYLEKGIE